MSYVWIIFTSHEGEIAPYMNISFKTKHKSKVGKYIRNNISEFVSIFTIIKCFDCYASDSICRLQEKLESLVPDMADENDESIIEQIKEILEEFSDEEIVDEINECVDASNERSIKIMKIPVNKMITL